MKRRARVAILAVALASPSSAKAAEGDVEPVRIRFDAYPGCPDVARFFDQIHARTLHVRRAKDGEVARTLRVSVALEHGRSVGRIVIEEATQASVPRSVEAATCAEAVDAIALIAALSIDPNASTAPIAPIAPGPPTAPIAEPPETPEPPPGPPIAPIAPEPTSTKALSVSHHTTPAAPAPAAPSRWTFASGLGVDAVSLGSIEASPRVFIDMTRDGPSVLAPSFRLTGARAAEDVAGAAASQTARMVWLTGALAVCPLHGLAQRIDACADVDAGILQGRPGGKGTHTRTRPWIAPGLSVRLRAVTFSFARRGAFFLEAEAGARVPLQRDEFYFEPSTTVYKAPSVVFRAGLAAGVRFW